MAELDRLVILRSLWRGGHPVLRCTASNVAVRQDPAGNIKPDKEPPASGSTAYRHWSTRSGGRYCETTAGRFMKGEGC
jgi:hypothetical protein